MVLSKPKSSPNPEANLLEFSNDYCCGVEPQGWSG